MDVFYDLFEWFNQNILKRLDRFMNRFKFSLILIETLICKHEQKLNMREQTSLAQSILCILKILNLNVFKYKIQLICLFFAKTLK